MTYVRITDPAKRDALIQQAISSRRNIFQDSLNEQLGEISMQQSFSKMFKPVTEKLESTQQAVQELAKPIQALPDALQAITAGPSIDLSALPPPHDIPAIASTSSSLPRFPGEITTHDIMIGNIAGKHISELGYKYGEVDRSYGIRHVPGHPGKFAIGNKQVLINNDDLTVDGKTYKGTPGLWELLVSLEPKGYTEDDLKNYEEILIATHAMHRNYDVTNSYPEATRSKKWKIIKPIWDKYKPSIPKASKIPQLAKASATATAREQPNPEDVLDDSILDTFPLGSTMEGEGITGNQPVILSSDPDMLLNRLDLLLASKAAGNTGVRNELVAICDVLFKQGTISKEQYKNLNIIINNDC